MHRALRFLLTCALACAAVYTPACGDDSDDPQPAKEGTTVSVDDVIFAEDGGDEALKGMLGLSATADASKAAAFTLFTEGAQLPGATPHTFQWARPQTGLLLPLRRVPPREPVLRLFGPPVQAHAHGDAVNGEGYFVVFSVPGNDKLLRLFTTKTSFAPGPASWELLKGAQGPIKAVITTATFDNDNVVVGGGPYASVPVSFTIAP